jgi:hypothetical protein
MGTYIKNFVPPKNCADCDDDMLRTAIGCPYFADTGRHKDCPLVEVKTPHGRLLDENEVKNTFKFSEDAEYARWTLAGVFMDIEDTEAVLESEE